MGAGAVLQATGTRNLEAMGGLIRRMPQTAALFLIGSLAIAGLPPFNGFISEWLTFQGLLSSFQISRHTVNLIFVLGIAALALTSGLAAACFVRAFGIAFLALPRSAAAAQARIALGLAPALLLPALEATGFELLGAHADLRFNAMGVAAGGGFGAVAP